VEEPDTRVFLLTNGLILIALPLGKPVGFYEVRSKLPISVEPISFLLIGLTPVTDDYLLTITNFFLIADDGLIPLTPLVREALLYICFIRYIYCEISVFIVDASFWYSSNKDCMSFDKPLFPPNSLF